jgi:hypothetical protein
VSREFAATSKFLGESPSASPEDVLGPLHAFLKEFDASRAKVMAEKDKATRDSRKAAQQSNKSKAVGARVCLPRCARVCSCSFTQASGTTFGPGKLKVVATAGVKSGGAGSEDRKSPSAPED